MAPPAGRIVGVEGYGRFERGLRLLQMPLLQLPHAQAPAYGRKVRGRCDDPPGCLMGAGPVPHGHLDLRHPVPRLWVVFVEGEGVEIAVESEGGEEVGFVDVAQAQP